MSAYVLYHPARKSFISFIVHDDGDEWTVCGAMSNALFASKYFMEQTLTRTDLGVDLTGYEVREVVMK